MVRSNAKLLILGSLPGAESLRRQQYYAHPQNAFWRIMGTIAGFAPDLPYEQRLNRMTAHGAALWDVCAAAERIGSLDSAIKTPQPNNFAQFFTENPGVKLVAFNGQPASKLYARLVKPQLALEHIEFVVLPSTSPAHARMRFEEKLRRWREALKV